MAIKNIYLLQLIKKTLEYIYETKSYNKIDIIIVFNYLQIQQKKGRKLLLKPGKNYINILLCLLVLLMHFYYFKILSIMFYKRYLMIFILFTSMISRSTKTPKKYQIYICKIFSAIQKTNLLLNINKYKFCIIKINYLELILFIKNIYVNTKKVKVF